MLGPDVAGVATDAGHASIADALEPRSFWDKRYEDGSAPEEWYCENKRLESIWQWALDDDEVSLPLLLNIGCGTSELCSRLVRTTPLLDCGGLSRSSCMVGGGRRREVLGIDVSLPALHSRAPGPASFLAADMLKLPFRDATFDAIVDKGTVDWMGLSLLVDDDRDVILARLREELRRILRPGGRLVVVTGLGKTSEDPLTFLLEGDADAWDYEEDKHTRILDDMQWNYCCHVLIRRLDSTFHAPSAETAAVEKAPAAAEDPAMEWSAEQQTALEGALQRHPATLDKNERWRLIAKDVRGKTKSQCVERFKYLRELIKKKG